MGLTDIIGIVFLVLFFGCIIFFASFDLGREDDHCINWHRLHGKWRVKYPDGQVSQPFSRKIAEDYQKLFGGEVISR